ncbi:MAG: methylated-DNA--[protein]-cysteine S-methyltransferase [Clostridiales bacterium]|nr:methylated-DNA--[protein]-cysteine S-methyltransferase [Clostridiales bacterium]
MRRFGKYISPLGTITLAGDGEFLVGLWLEGQKGGAAGADIRPEKCCPGVIEETKRWLDVYFSGREPDFLPPVRFFGSPFQVRVWELLERIPYGTTVTYGGIAEKIASETGKNTSARAVGRAVGQNPISIVVPCHRVVGANGSLTGYAGGLDRKRSLLALEGVDAESLPDLSRTRKNKTAARFKPSAAAVSLQTGDAIL